MNIRNLFEEKKCVFSFEMFPPKKNSDDINAMYETIDGLKRLGPDYISITYGAGGSGGRGTERLAAHIKSAYPEFNVAGACYPEGHVEAESRYEDIKNLRKKVEAGVTHLNSQLFFDNEDFFEFSELLSLAGIDVPVQAGIMPVVRLKQVDRIISLAGVKIPSRLSRLLSRYGSDAEALADAGIAYATEQIADLIAGGVRGIHVYVMNNVEVAARITENVRSMLNRVNND